MMLRARILISAISLLACLASAAGADKGASTEAVRKVNTAISKMLSARADSKEEERRLLERARTKLGDFLNIEELGQRAMKDHWPTLSPHHRTEFLSLLRSLIETKYLEGLRANLKYDTTYLREKFHEEYVLVQTVVTSERRGRPLKIEIDYLLSRSGRTWRTFDITTDGIGLVENYRAMFNSIIARSGFDGLMGRMRKKLAASTR